MEVKGSKHKQLTVRELNSGGKEPVTQEVTFTFLLLRFIYPKAAPKNGEIFRQDTWNTQHNTQFHFKWQPLSLTSFNKYIK